MFLVLERKFYWQYLLSWLQVQLHSFLLQQEDVFLRMNLSRVTTSCHAIYRRCWAWSCWWADKLEVRRWLKRCCWKRSKQKQSVCSQLEQMLSKVQKPKQKAKKPWACLALVWERLCLSFNSASRLLKLFTDVCCDEFPTLTGWGFCAVCLSHFFQGWIFLMRSCID